MNAVYYRQPRKVLVEFVWSSWVIGSEYWTAMRADDGRIWNPRRMILHLGPLKMYVSGHWMGKRPAGR